jgi:hypothetical protein
MSYWPYGRRSPTAACAPPTWVLGSLATQISGRSSATTTGTAMPDAAYPLGMAELIRGEDGTWRLDGATSDEAASEHGKTQPRYLTAIDRVFATAKAQSEFDFLHCLIPVFSLQEAGWDPYETTIRAVASTLELIEDAGDFEKARHLQLWLWGHIVEASAPYELLARLIAVCSGERPRQTHFPDSERGLPQSPAQKIDALRAAACKLDLGDLIGPLIEVWDRDLRNAVFHADYTLYGGVVRIPRIPADLSRHDP